MGTLDYARIIQGPFVTESLYASNHTVCHRRVSLTSVDSESEVLSFPVLEEIVERHEKNSLVFSICFGIAAALILEITVYVDLEPTYDMNDASVRIMILTALFAYLCHRLLMMLVIWRGRGNYGERYTQVRERVAQRNANQAERERNRGAEKKAERPTKKVFFGLWERELTTREMLNEWIYKPALEEIQTAREEGDHERASEVLQRLGIEDSDSSDDSGERRKAGVVDYLDAATMVRCTHCDGPTEGGPRRGTYLCASCGFLFDSHGNAI